MGRDGYTAFKASGHYSMGYDAKSILYDANSMIYDLMVAHNLTVYKDNEIMGYDYVQ